jgi:DNA-binding FrmR family transcriptional regulator
MGRIERAPNWILKYKERIERGTTTVEAILEEENRLREEPIKISSVTRAINAMGCPITGLRRGNRTEVGRTKTEVKGERQIGKKSEISGRGPGWLQEYRARIEKKTITVEDILENENELREVPIKLSTVTRAINTMGYPIIGLRRGKKSEIETEVAEEKKKGVETIGEKERVEGIERGPAWLQKYRERIEKGTITVEDILEEENRLRDVPIKISSVTRAVNAMGYPLVGLRRGVKAEAEVKGVKQVKKEERQGKVEKGPGWLQKYRERIEKGTITVEDILEGENRLRDVPIKISSVTRAVNAMGYPLVGLRREGKEQVKRLEKPTKAGMIDAYSHSIGKISEETEHRFTTIKKSWEDDLGKPLHNDYFVNVLLALAKLAEYGKTLVPVTK